MKNDEARPPSTPRRQDHPSLRAFAEWLERYLASDDRMARRQLEREGIDRARRRERHLRALITVDPRAAVAAAIPESVRTRLPPAVLAHVEVPVKGRGDLWRSISCDPATGRASVERQARVDGRVFVAHVHGRYARASTLLDVPIEGVALGVQLAIADDVAAQPLDPTPHQRQRGIPQAVQSAAGGLPPRVNALGALRILLIRVQFPDEPTEPATYAAADAAMAEADQFYRTWSRGRTWLTWDVTATCYMLDRRQDSYAFDRQSDPRWALHGDASGKAAADYPGPYDKVLVLFPQIRFLVNPETGRLALSCWFDWSGLADVPAPGDPPGRRVLLNGRVGAGLVTHEIGHTFSLRHANRWETNDHDVVGSGMSLEYGDPFDAMGGERHLTDERHVFNPMYLYALGWRDADEVVAVDAPGDYIVKRFDHLQASGTQALVVARGLQSYWIGLRGSFAANTDLSQGAYIVWAGPSTASNTQLLDFSPQTGTFLDAALDEGQPFSDTDYAITMDVIEYGGATPDEYLKVRIGFPQVAPFIIRPPQPVTALVGTRPQMTVVAGGSRDLHYEWRRNGVAVSFGTDSSTLTFPPLIDDLAGAYTVVITNDVGEIESIPVQLIVVHEPPRLVRRSMYRNARYDLSSVTFSVEIASDLPVTYVWTHFGNHAVEPGAVTVLPDAQDGVLTLSNLNLHHDGRYVCVATTAAGSVRVPFMLKVLPYHTTVGAFGASDGGALEAPYNIGGVIAIGAGDQYSVALKQNGQLVAWGNGSSTADLAMLDDVVAIAIGDFICWALRADGTVWEWGFFAPRQVVGLVNVIAISVNSGNLMALRDDGTVAFRYVGSLPSYPSPELSNVADISAGEYHGAALMNDDTVRIWGLPSVYDPPGSTLTDAVGIACGDTHALILKSDGSVVGVGTNEASHPTDAAQEGWVYSVREVAAGSRHSLTIRLHPWMPGGADDPSLLQVIRILEGWGDNSGGQASLGWDFNSELWGVAAGKRHSLVIMGFMRG